MAMMIISYIESVQRSGFSKTGNPYHIDETQVTVQVPVDSDDAFGYKSMTYVYGDHSRIEGLRSLRGQLPIKADIELTVDIDTYGNPKTIISQIKPLAQIKDTKPETK